MVYEKRNSFTNFTALQLVKKTFHKLLREGIVYKQVVSRGREIGLQRAETGGMEGKLFYKLAVEPLFMPH